VRVEVVPYDSAWPERFDTIRSELSAALTAVSVVAIEHVGSTSVPGLAAKPIVDIDVVVARDNVQSAIAALEAAGYASLGDLGVPDRYALRPPDDGVRRNVYVIVDGSLSLRNHCAVRAALLADEKLRREYGDLKLALAQRDFDTIDDYVAAKSPVLQRILERGGIDECDRGEIAAINDPRA
jgi:GrpB-like predicted nucleotidyltransferase (UPF0157 family)